MFLTKIDLPGGGAVRKQQHAPVPVPTLLPSYTHHELLDALGDAVIDEMLDAIAAGDKTLRRIDYRFSRARVIDVTHPAVEAALDYMVATLVNFNPADKNRIMAG